MFKKRSVYILGTLLLLVGLLWLHSGHLLHALPMEDHMESNKHQEEMGHDVNLGFSLLGVIPTLLGLYLIEKHNRSLGRH